MFYHLLKYWCHHFLRQTNFWTIKNQLNRCFYDIEVQKLFWIQVRPDACSVPSCSSSDGEFHPRYSIPPRAIEKTIVEITVEQGVAQWAYALRKRTHTNGQKISSIAVVAVLLEEFWWKSNLLFSTENTPGSPISEYYLILLNCIYNK